MFGKPGRVRIVTAAAAVRPASARPGASNEAVMTVMAFVIGMALVVPLADLLSRI